LDYDYNQLEAILNKQQLNESCNFKKSNETDNKPQAKYYNKPQQAISNSRFLAVLGIHLFGLLSDIEQIQKLVGDPAVSVVEDTAQAMGSEKNDKLLGTHGEVGFFSLGRGKPLSGVEGGIIITNKDDLAEAINRMFPKVHGYNVSEHIKLILNAFALLIFQRPHFFWFPKSLAFLRVGDTFYDPHFKIRKLSAFQSGLVKNWREKLAKFQNDRRENTMQWHSIAKLSNIHQYCSQNGNFLPLLKYPVIIENKKMLNMILEESDKNGHGIMLTYPDSINGIDELIELFKGQNFPAAKNLPHQLLTLPVHPYVKRQDMEKISKLFSKAENHVKQVRCV
jgi:dTDP-4-amino-4,6-dideoxygalactose transaminase